MSTMRMRMRASNPSRLALSSSSGEPAKKPLKRKSQVRKTEKNTECAGDSKYTCATEEEFVDDPNARLLAEITSLPSDPGNCDDIHDAEDLGLSGEDRAWSLYSGCVWFSANAKPNEFPPQHVHKEDLEFLADWLRDAHERGVPLVVRNMQHEIDKVKKLMQCCPHSDLLHLIWIRKQDLDLREATRECEKLGVRHLADKVFVAHCLFYELFPGHEVHR